MKNNKINDERIVSQRRKIQSDAFSILVYFLAVSIVVQQFLLKAPFSQFAVEFFSLIAMGIYISIRHLSMGLDLTDSEASSSKKLLFNSIFSGTLSIIFLMVMGGERNPLLLVILFMGVSVSFFSSHMVFQSLLKKKNKELDDQFNEEE